MIYFEARAKVSNRPRADTGFLSIIAKFANSEALGRVELGSLNFYLAE